MDDLKPTPAPVKPLPQPPRIVDIHEQFGKVESYDLHGMSLVLENACSDYSTAMGAIESPQGWGQARDPHERFYTFHWEVTNWRTCYNDYHAVVVYNPATKTPYIVVVRPFNIHGQHLWGRNAGCIGIAFAACYDAHPGVPGKGAYYGPYAPTPEMIELASQFVAEHMAWRQRVPGTLVTLAKKACNDTQIWTVPGSFQVNIVTDHSTIAKHDGYAGARWDIDGILPTVENRIATIYRELKGVAKPDGSKRGFEFEEQLKSWPSLA